MRAMERFELVAYKFDALWSALFGEVDRETAVNVLQQFAKNHGLRLDYNEAGRTIEVCTSQEAGWPHTVSIAHGMYFFDD